MSAELEIGRGAADATLVVWPEKFVVEADCNSESGRTSSGRSIVCETLACETVWETQPRTARSGAGSERAALG
jgi:hypothetical protein